MKSHLKCKTNRLEACKNIFFENEKQALETIKDFNEKLHHMLRESIQEDISTDDDNINNQHDNLLKGEPTLQTSLLVIQKFLVGMKKKDVENYLQQKSLMEQVSQQRTRILSMESQLNETILSSEIIAKNLRTELEEVTTNLTKEKKMASSLASQLSEWREKVQILEKEVSR
ncbi:hypothetical protein HELRODRAFT_165449 [Helobdella robusta]|uniref:Uncharacterized protein n=1 Tax=Helobdella robusta TaxID=6412 RepID=T1EWT6_HELRO|nr:hypothetical protein HELRODRAFT_165449 [Helobdella robusta]ESN91418.1 hypothetical protein HELRODRAFT_165449 [Helobdella robusta]